MFFPMQQCEFWSLCAQMCIHHVGRAWIWGAELGGWRRTGGLDWLACDYSGCQVFTERWGGKDSCFHSVLETTHIHTLALTREAGAVLETPQALQCVCVFVLQLAAGTSGKDWQAYTHQVSQVQLSMVQAEWMQDFWPGQPRKIMQWGLKG